MRIAYIHYLYGNDTALNHVREFADAARRLGHDIRVWAMNLAPAPFDGAAAQSLTPRSVLRNALKWRLSRYLHEPKELLWTGCYVRKEVRLLRARPPDVLLVRDHALTASCIPVARRLQLPLVVEFNAPAVESRLYFDEYLHVPLLGDWLERWKLHAADAVTVVSASLKKYFVARHGLDPEKVVVVPNGADLRRFRPGLPPDSLVDDGAGGLLVGFVGSFQKWHGPDLLAAMMMQVATARPSVRFLLVGDGPGLPGVRQATTSLGHRVTFTGRMLHERMPGLIAALDVAVMPDSTFYCSPLKVIEWMAAGRAVVAPGYPPLQELITDGVEGLLFPPRDLDALTRAVLRLLDDPSLRRTMGVRAAAKAHASLSWLDNAERVLTACHAAMKRRAAVPRSGTVRCAAS